VTNEEKTSLKAACLQAATTRDTWDLLKQIKERRPWAAIVLREWPDFQTALRIAAASYALAGRLAEARSTRLRLQMLDPQLHLST
jgi:capsule polysaccharide export protein KpsC/LpsZ